MKKQTYLPIIFGLIIIIVLGFLITQKKDTYTPLGLNPVAHANAYCYLYEGVVVDDEGTELGINREYIEFAINDNSQEIQGIHNVTPAQGTAHSATLMGITDQGYMNAVATVRSEGSTWQEQRIYRFTDEELYVGYQLVDIPRIKNEFGVFMYEDIYEITFATEDFFLHRVSCEDSARFSQI